MAVGRIIGPANRAELIRLLGRARGRVAFLAGGTDLIPRLGSAKERWDLVIDLSQTTDLAYIREEDGVIRIGAGTTMASLAASPLLRAKAAGLAQAAGGLGSVEIRQRATLGGNLANASPAADSFPPLTVLGAKFKSLARGPDGVQERPERPVDACGGGLAPGTLLTEVSFPAPAAACRSAFVKLGTRRTVSVARLSLALLVELDEAGRVIRSGRLALGALGETPLCPDDLSDFLAGRPVDDALGRDLAQRLSAVVAGAIPGRASCPYKSQAVKGLALDLLAATFGRAFEMGAENG